MLKGEGEKMLGEPFLPSYPLFILGNVCEKLRKRQDRDRTMLLDGLVVTRLEPCTVYVLTYYNIHMRERESEKYIPLQLVIHFFPLRD